MRRVLTVVVLVVTLSFGQTAHAASSSTYQIRSSLSKVATTRDYGPCDAARWRNPTPKTWTKWLIAGLIRCAVEKWSVPGGADKAIATWDCESSLYPWSHTSTYTYLGVGQDSASSWLGWVHTYLRARWFSKWQWEHINQKASPDNPHPAYNARANVILNVRMAHRRGWGPWQCA